MFFGSILLYWQQMLFFKIHSFISTIWWSWWLLAQLSSCQLPFQLYFLLSTIIFVLCFLLIFYDFWCNFMLEVNAIFYADNWCNFYVKCWCDFCIDNWYNIMLIVGVFFMPTIDAICYFIAGNWCYFYIYSWYYFMLFFVMMTIDTILMLKGDATPILIVGVVIVMFLCHVNNWCYFYVSKICYSYMDSWCWVIGQDF